MMDETADCPVGDYAIVELFGHTTLVGRIAEVESFGTKMLQIEALFDGKLLPPVLNGGQAIYRLTPCSREIAFAKQTRHTWQLPVSLRCILPPALIEDDTARTTGLNVHDDDDDLHG